jgi:hypothetical protein
MPINPQDLRTHILEAARIARRLPPNSAEAFCEVCAELSKVRGLTRSMALDVARESMPGSYRAFCIRQEQHTAPEIFPHKEGYQERRAAMAARGGRLN